MIKLRRVLFGRSYQKALGNLAKAYNNEIVALYETRPITNSSLTRANDSKERAREIVETTGRRAGFSSQEVNEGLLTVYKTVAGEHEATKNIFRD